MMKTYMAVSGSVTGSSGFTNHFAATHESLMSALQRCFSDHPDAVVLDGCDDFTDPEWKRPERFVRELGVQSIALFHSGTSGLTNSGIVIEGADYERLSGLYRDKYGRELDESVDVYSRESLQEAA